MSDVRPSLVVGVGNRLRCDDGVGLRVAERVAERAPEGVEVVLHGGEVASLLELWEGRARVVVVDAMLAGGAWPPGTIVRFDAVASSLPTGAFTSTHAFGVAEAVELGRALGQLPPRLVVFAVASRWFEHGATLSDPVAGAVDEVVERVLAELEGG